MVLRKTSLQALQRLSYRPYLFHAKLALNPRQLNPRPIFSRFRTGNKILHKFISSR